MSYCASAPNCCACNAKPANFNANASPSRMVSPPCSVNRRVSSGSPPPQAHAKPFTPHQCPPDSPPTCSRGAPTSSPRSTVSSRPYNLTGQARLDRLPTIALIGSGGSSSDSLGGLLNQWLLGGGPVISIPLFDPAKKRQVAVREAEFEIASDQYRSTVIKAFQEVENSLVSLESRRRQTGQADDALADLREAQRINQAQFEEGLISQLQVLESERSLMQSEQIALDLHFRQLNETVTLYKALGGGWPPETL